MTEDRQLRYLVVHGYRRAYVKMGTGPAILLLHGLGCDHTTWDPVIDRLAEHYTVIAPDFLGHGQSDKPRADYTVGGYANGMRDLLTILGIDKVTVVGHSFGGGVAMQFAYQFPERTERLVLVNAGGLGPEVTALIRAISLPGWNAVMAGLTVPGLRHLNVAAFRALSRFGPSVLRDLDEVANIYEGFKDPAFRHAIRSLTRAVVDVKGQVITMSDRAYLTEAMPLLVIWGEDDHVIPSSHAGRAAMMAPAARVEVLADAGHFPFKDHPERFAEILLDFMASTKPAAYSRARWRRILREGKAESVPAVVPAVTEASGN
ncbi:alpha/beta fold hydrolase [soil metagenome]